MPFVDNQGVQIYYQEDGDPEKPALVLSHWFMGSYQTWYDIGWVRVLSPHFRLIMIDHRGYGKSTKLYDPEDYHPTRHVSDIEAVMDHLDIDQVHFFGYSMGGRIGFAMAVYAPHRLDRLIIGGMHPYASEFVPTDLDERVELLKQGMEVTLTTYGIGPEKVFNRMLGNDSQALLADTLQTKRWEDLDGLLKTYDRPVLLFVGEQDGFYEGAKKISQEMIDCRFIAFPGENHRSSFLKRTLLVPHVKRFFRI